MTLEEEIARRNEQCLESYAVKRSLRKVFPDPCSPEWRILVNKWFQERRELALRWLFKRRCELRKSNRNFTWAKSGRYT